MLPRRSQRQQFELSSTRRRLAIAAALLAIASLVPQGFQTEALSDAPIEEFRAFVAGQGNVDIAAFDAGAVHRWLIGRVAFNFPPLASQSDGFELLGGRLCLISGQKMASYVYRRDKVLLSIYIVAADKVNLEGQQKFIYAGSSLSLRSSHGLNQISWQNGSLLYVIVSNLALDRAIAALMALHQADI